MDLPERRKQEENGRRHLVQTTAEKLREWILSLDPDVQLGSLKEVSERLGVGIVTVQQAARILEHEGLLAVRRGPGGGYYGTRPDEGALERAFATYMRVHGFDYREVFEIISLLDCETIPEAAHCTDDSLREQLRALGETIDQCDTMEKRVAFENQWRDLLFQMVARPLIELITRANYHLYRERPEGTLFMDEEGVRSWKAGKRRILKAILARDAELAAFEARRNRREILSRMPRRDGSKRDPHTNLP